MEELSAIRVSGRRALSIWACAHVDVTGEDWQNCAACGGGADVGLTVARYEREARDGLPQAIRFLVWF